VKRTGTKEDKGNTMMLAILQLRLAKGTSWGNMISSIEEIKPVALSIVRLRLAEGNS